MPVKDLRLEHGNSVQTPATRDATEEEEPEQLSQVQHSKYMSQVSRCLFVSQDRADITSIVNELSQRMSRPTQRSFAKRKRLVRYLKRERQSGQIFKYGRMVEEVTAFTDWNLAGCKETRKPSSAGVMLLGDQSCPEIAHAQTKDHCKKQCRGRAARGKRLSRKELCRC